MDHEVKKYLFDIQEAINSIEEYLGDTRDFTVYETASTGCGRQF